MARIAFCANTAWNIHNFRAPIIDALLVTPELEAYAKEHYPADTVVFSSMLKPVE